jgi:hypothetical protein
MPTYRKLTLGAGAMLAAVSLTIAGTVASSASPSARDAVGRSSKSVIPSPTAPHVGHVAGVQYGPHISTNNHQAVHAFKTLHNQMRGTGHPSKTDIDTIHEYVGTSFNADTVGSQATQSVSTKIHAGPQTPALYTPTMYPSGGGTPGSCIEISTAYLPGSDTVAAWDWCHAIRFVAQKTINRSFMQTYTKKKNYSVQILQTDPSNNTWTAYLYNYDTGKWEKFYSQSGTSQAGLGEGWDIYEIYSEIKGDGQSYACDDLAGKRIEAKGIKVGVGGNLVTADPSHAGDDYDVPLSQFQCDSLTYNMLKPFSHWKAIG